MAERVDYALTAAEEALLLAATKDSMAAAGALGGSLGAPIDTFGGARGGAAGGRFGARMTRPRTAASVVDVVAAPEAVLELARRSVEAHGHVIDDPNGAGDGAVWGLVRSGALDMMPALVRVAAEPAGAGTRVHVRATGREGLIKQRIGAKAVDRICEAIAAGRR